MNILKKISAFLAPPHPQDRSVMWVYVRCDRCDEPLRSRVNLLNDLSVRYGETVRDDTFIIRKTILGSGICHQPIQITLIFNDHRKVKKREIEGGQFITAEEYFSR
jgi:hypothetical protein